ncbi:MAG TPA: HEAT repeat domain-containing protein [Thermodesulfovibrionales bacterium]|nr:HEAT repeat domain-containing protein [Thermodesulfovibrionales bacterium]
MNIAFVTFIKGLEKDELYEFNRFITEHVKELADAPQEVLKERVTHIKAGFIDYSAFSFEEGKTDKATSNVQLWERYIYGLLQGTLQTDEISDEIGEIPPGMLASILNRSTADNLKEETYDKVITTYLRKSSEKTFSSKELKKLMDFINNLRPELKRQFLSSAVRTVSKNIESVDEVLSEVQIDDVIQLLNTMNEQKVTIPRALKNLLDKLSRLPQNSTDLVSKENPIVDDIFLSPDIISLFEEGHLEMFMTHAYQKDIQKLLDFDPSKFIAECDELKRKCSDDCIEKDFDLTILELLSSNITSKEDYEHFIIILKEQMEQFIWTGQYRQVLETLNVLESNVAENRFSDLTSEALQYYHSPEFISQLVESFRILGRQMREEAFRLCEYYGEKIISPLMDGLIKEESQTVRRFFICLLKNFGDKAIPEAIKRLGDSRWFVKRNMLYILSGCSGLKILPHVRPYCYHENHKVSFEAIKCLLSAKDSYGIKALRDSLRSDSREIVNYAIALSGSFKVKEVVTDLVQMLKKRGMTSAEIYDKIPIVKALGEIGSPDALQAFREVLSGKSIIFKKALEKLKEEIYKTLKNYSYEDIEDLIMSGLDSKNQYIRAESSQLKRRV